MKKIYLIILLALSTLFHTESFSQCSVSPAYTTGSNGLVNFTSNVTGTGTYTYSWSFGDGTYSSAINPSHTYLYNFSYWACIYIYDSLFCSDSACVLVQVTNASQTVTCPGNAAFTFSPNGTTTNLTNPNGNWMIADFGDGLSSVQTTGTVINHQYLMNGTYQVTAVAYGLFGSNYFPCDTSVQVITVNNVPCQAAFTAWTDTSVNSIYCSNQSLGGANTTWYVDGNVAGTNVDDLYTGLLLPGTHTVCLVITGTGGCYDSTCQNITLTGIIPCPNVSFSYVPLSGCDSYQFTVNNSGPPLTSVNWYHNLNWASSLLTVPLTLDFSSSQNIYQESVSVSVQGTGCSSSQNFVFTNPAAFWIQLDMDTSTGSGNIWYAYPQVVAGVTYELWDFGDGTTSNLPYPTHVFTVAGYYNVCHTITVNGTCNYTYCTNGYFYRGTQSQSVSTFIVVGPTGIQQNTALNTLRIYPNPSSDYFLFDFGNPVPEDHSLKIYNSIGAIVKTGTIEKGMITYAQDIKSLPAGIYFYKITAAPGNEMRGILSVK